MTLKKKSAPLYNKQQAQIIRDWFKAHPTENKCHVMKDLPNHNFMHNVIKLDDGQLLVVDKDSSNGAHKEFLGYFKAKIQGDAGGVGKCKYAQVLIDPANPSLPLKHIVLKVCEDNNFPLQKATLQALGLFRGEMSRKEYHLNGRSKDKFYCAMDFIEGQNLKIALQENKIPSDKIILVAYNMAKALQQFYKKTGRIHGDLKEANCLVDKNFKIKLVDFDNCRRFDKQTGEAIEDGLVRGTSGYIAPSILTENRYSLSSDIYALGVSFNTLAQKISDTKQRNVLASLANQMLSDNRNNRPKLDVVLKKLETHISPSTIPVSDPLKKFDELEFPATYQRVENQPWDKLYQHLPANLLATLLLAHQLKTIHLNTKLKLNSHKTQYQGWDGFRIKNVTIQCLADGNFKATGHYLFEQPKAHTEPMVYYQNFIISPEKYENGGLVRLDQWKKFFIEYEYKNSNQAEYIKGLQKDIQAFAKAHPNSFFKILNLENYTQQSAEEAAKHICEHFKNLSIDNFSKKPDLNALVKEALNSPSKNTNHNRRHYRRRMYG